MRLRRSRLLALTAVVAALTGCAGSDDPTSPVARLSTATGDDPTLGDVTTREARLLVCPSSVSQTAIVSMGVYGGTVQVGDVRFAVPAGALRAQTTFVVKVPASQHLEVDIHALGYSSFHFEAPVTISIGYRRCGDVSGPFRAWYIDHETDSLLENMGGVTDSFARTHTFQTSHLSGYAIAN